MSPSSTHRLPRLRLTVAAAIVALLATALAPFAERAEAAAPPPDGASAATAAASCWEIKQNVPTAPSGVYWLVTPKLGAPQQFYCDQVTDGGGWVLVGRGRQDWSTSNEGFGTAAQVRDVVTGTAAFAPRQLSSETIDALLNGQGVSSLTEGIRLRRATTTDGSAWQEVTFKISSPRSDWTWMFENNQRVGTWRIGAATGSGGTTTSFGTGSNLERVQTTVGSAQGWVAGFGFGTSARGTADASSYIWAPNTSAPNPRPFTQVFLRPRLMSATVFTAIPDAGTPAVVESGVAESLAQTTVWGVSGLGAGSGEGNNEVSAFAEGSGVMYVGGNFRYVQKTAAGGNRVEQSYLAAFNMATGEWISSFRPVFNNQVKALAVLPDGRLAVGGFFTQVNGQARPGLTVLNPTTGATDTVFTGRLINYLSGGVPFVRTLDVQDGWLYVGGSFTHSTGGSTSAEVYTRAAARFSVTNGTPSTWNPEFNGTVMSLDANPGGDRVYFAGFFSASRGATTEKAAAIRTSDASAFPWSIVFSNRVGGRSGYQQTVKEVGNKIWLGGSEHSLFSYDRNTFSIIDSNITLAGGDFQAIDSRNGIVYAGCHCFHTNYSGVTSWPDVGTGWTRASKIDSIGAWDSASGSFLPAFSPILSERVGAGAWAINVDSTGTTWAGGDFEYSYRAGFVKQWSGGFVRFSASDSAPPSTPTGLTAANDGTTTTLNWGASTDNRGAPVYEILRTDRVVATTTALTLALPDTTPGTRYFVRAADANGNRSASTAVAVATAPDPDDPVDTVVIATGATWKYYYQVAAPSGAWTTPSYDDSSWPSGPTPIGWGHANIATPISLPAPQPLTSYYRTSFPVADASETIALTLKTRADDGIVIYLNGTEVARSNMPAGVPNHGTYASTAISATVAGTNPLTFTVPVALLVDGSNVLTAEVHSNYRATPSASLDLVATLTTSG